MYNRSELLTRVSDGRRHREAADYSTEPTEPSCRGALGWAARVPGAANTKRTGGDCGTPAAEPDSCGRSTPGVAAAHAATAARAAAAEAAAADAATGAAAGAAARAASRAAASVSGLAASPWGGASV